MRISELIEALKAEQVKHGDIEVFAFDGGCALTCRQFEPVTAVEGDSEVPGLKVLEAPAEFDDATIRAYLDRHPTAFREFLHREVRCNPAWLREYLVKETRIAGRFPFQPPY